MNSVRKVYDIRNRVQAAMANYKIPGEHIYDGIVFGEIFPADVLDAVKKFTFREDDILIATYPKSGTTWMEEIVDLVKKDANISAVKDIPLDVRIPFLEIRVPGSCHGNPFERLETLPSPRIVKTHLPYQFFEETFEKVTPKCVVVMRNLKDVLVSYYHFYKCVDGFGHFTGTFSDYLELFKAKRLCQGDWFDFNLGWWKQNGDSRFHFAKYEEMKIDSKGEIRKIADFLGKTLSDDEIEAIADHTSFGKMKANPMTNKTNMDDVKGQFMRKGIVGDWKKHFTAEENNYVDDLLKEKLEGTGLHFHYSS